MDNVKFPDIDVRLVGGDGNAFAIIGSVIRALKNNNVDAETINEFKEEAMSGDYNHLLVTCMKWVNVE